VGVGLIAFTFKTKTLSGWLDLILDWNVLFSSNHASCHMHAWCHHGGVDFFRYVFIFCMFFLVCLFLTACFWRNKDAYIIRPNLSHRAKHQKTKISVLTTSPASYSAGNHSSLTRVFIYAPHRINPSPRMTLVWKCSSFPYKIVLYIHLYSPTSSTK